MADLLLDYRLEDTSVANPDGSFPAFFTGTAVVPGPGTTAFGAFPKALDLGSVGKTAVALDGLEPDLNSFCVRVIFRAGAPVAGRQSLVESNLLPFALYLDKAPHFGDFNLVAAVAPRAHGWHGPDTLFKKQLKAGRWYTAELAYDTDTAAIFLDGECIGVHAFPDGSIEESGGQELFIGTETDGESGHFDGSLAAFQWYSGIPTDNEALLNERRVHPEWFVTYKRESVRGEIDLGERTSDLGFLLSAGASRVQRYERGAILYHEGAGAFVLHGPIHDLYFSVRQMPGDLGYLVNDEEDTAQEGGRKSLFSRGGIYWSPRTGAVAVSGEIYLEYEMFGESKAIGLPARRARSTPDGVEQEFQRARMYFKFGAEKACEVHGEILARFLATGGLTAWGYPTSNVFAVVEARKEIGRQSNFERCTFFWSKKTRAHEVHGDIRKRYEKLSGPRGALGFPTSDEADIPGVDGGARFNTFAKGSILWFGDEERVVVANPFQVFLGRIASKEVEGFLQGQNDIFCRLTLKEGGSTLHSERLPRKGAWDGHNVVEPKFTIPTVVNPNDPAKSLTLVVDVWDYDSGGGGANDHLGTWTQTLDIANGWGFREQNGILDSGSFSKIRSIKASVKRHLDIDSLSEIQKWWGVRSENTPVITLDQYAKAFRDVGNFEAWDVTDWLQIAFYEIIIEDLAAHGNCFGMCLEAIYARKGTSVYGQPLDQFKRWGEVRDEFNVKHQYQYGSSTVWWFLDKVLTGATGGPREVFESTRAAFAAGNNPVLCLTKHWDFSGAAHVVMPVAWEDHTEPWEITVLDPYFPGQLRRLFVDKQQNRFGYSGTNDYGGGQWDGGRFYFIPFSLLNERPRTPVWEAIVLLLTGTALILGSDGETDGIADLPGRDLDAFGKRARERLRAGATADDCFVSFKGLGAAGGHAAAPGPQGGGELLLRRAPLGDFVHRVSGVRDGKLQYVVKQGMSEVALHSTLRRGEQAEVRASGLGTSNCELQLSSEEDKRVKLVLTNKLGVGGDHVTLTLDGVSVSASQELRLSPRPGLAGVELVGQIADRDSVVAVEGVVAGREFKRRFTVPLGEGISLKPSVAVTQDSLAVAAITQLFGNAIDGKLIQAM